MLEAQEDRCPLWAAIVPALYLLACAAAVRTVLQDPSAEIGVSGLLAAVGLIPAFAVPAVFASCRATLSSSNEGLLVDGRLVKLEDIRLQHRERGAGILHIVVGGRARRFSVSSYAEASRLVAALPPASVPAGALAA